MTPILAIITVGIAIGMAAQVMRLLKADATAQKALDKAISWRSALFAPALIGLIATLVARLTTALQAYLTPLMIQGFIGAAWSFIALFIFSFFLELFVGLRHERHCDEEEDVRIRKTIDALKNERAANEQGRSEV